MSIIFLIAGLGAINGFIVGTYLLFKKSRIPLDFYFGGLLFALSIRIAKSVFYHFDLISDRLILQTGLSACVFIGPFFYLYLKTIHREERRFLLKDKLLLLTLFLGITTIGIIFPYRTFPEIWNGIIIYWIYGIWIFFVLFGLIYGFRLMKVNREKWEKGNADYIYLYAIIIAMIVITMAYQFALFVGFTYIWGALVFSVSFYYVAWRALKSSGTIAPQTPVQPLEDAVELLNDVNRLMQEKKLFTNQRLKLDQVADNAGMSRHMLSRLLNEEYKHGFSSYIRELRVEEAKKLIATRPELSLEGIGYEAGFSSKSAFFESFKRVSKCTPAAFKKSIE